MEGLNSKKILFLALSLLIGLLMLNFVMRQIIVTKLLDNSSDKFAEISTNIVHLIDRRTSQYGNILLFARKLFESKDIIGREEFAHFFGEYFEKNKEALSGVEHVAYVERVTDTKAFVEKVRTEKTKTAFRFLYFNIASQHPNETRYVFNYLYPHTENSRFFGFDPSDSNELTRSFNQAAREGRQILSNEVDLFGTTYLFLIDPVYVQNPQLNAPREESVKGFVVLTIRKDEMFTKIFDYQTEESKKINIRVFFDDPPKHLFYEDRSIEQGIFDDGSKLLKNRLPTEFANRKLLVETETTPRLQLTEFEKVFPEVNFFISSGMVVMFFIIMITFRMRCDSSDNETP